MIVAIYLRKSNDEGDKHADVKSIAVQRADAARFAAERGWTLDDRYVFADDGVSGAVPLAERPGGRALLAVEPAPFQVLLVTEQSRIGRKSLDTLQAIQRIEAAGVEIWSVRDGRRISLEDDFSELMAMLESWRDQSERKKTQARVRAAARKRFEDGYVVSRGGFGYVVDRPAPKSPARLVKDESKAPIVVRLFESLAGGIGMVRLSKALNAEGIEHPRRAGNRGWTPATIRSLVGNPVYRGVQVYGTVKRVGPNRRKRTPRSEWVERPDEGLRFVSDDLWHAANNAIRQRGAAMPARGEVAHFRGTHLLSGFLICGADHAGEICGAPLIGTQRGKAGVSVYTCRAARIGACSNKSAVPLDLIERAVIAALEKTFSPEAFEQHLRQVASNDQEREARRREREALIAKLPKLTAAEAKLARAVALADDVEALVAELKALQQERKDAEARLVDLEAIERDILTERERIEDQRRKWQDWRGRLRADPAYARQSLRDVLACPIVVRPFRDDLDGGYVWRFVGFGRFDGLLFGAVGSRGGFVERSTRARGVVARSTRDLPWPRGAAPPDARAAVRPDADRWRVGRPGGGCA